MSVQMTPEMILGWTGCGTMVICYILPLIAFIQLIIKRVKYEEIPIAGITATFVNCLCWVIYANMIKCDPIKYCCFAGFGLSGLYIIIYLIYEARYFLLDAILNLLIVITGTYTLHQGLTVLFLEEKTLARICAVTNMVLYFSPLYLLCETCKTKNYKTIPIIGSIMYIITCLLWCGYAAKVKNMYIFGPKVFGVFIALIEVIVWKIYKEKFNEIPDYEKRQAKSGNRRIGEEGVTEGSGLNTEKMEFDTNPENSKVSVKVINEE